MRLAWFSPLPPMASGIADYSYELLPLLTETADVEVFCPRGLRRPKAPPGITVRRPKEFFKDPQAFDAVYYQLGNNPHHEFVYEAALAHPGICVFHDFVLHHLVAYAMVEGRRRQYQRYETTLTAEYGETGKHMADLKRDGVASDFEKFMFPLTAHVARRARGLIVHSQDSRERMHEVAPDVPIQVIPHHAGVPPAGVAGIDRAEARRRLKLPRDAFLVGHLGFVTRPKQPDAVVGGFARLWREHPSSHLFIVGADNTGGGLSRLVRRHGVEGAVTSTGFVDLDRFYLYVKAVDVVINLRYPSAGESSGTLSRSLAEGRVVIANNYASFSELPPEVCLKVEVDGSQAEQVGAHLIRLATDPALRARMEEAARRYTSTVLDPRRCRDMYLEFAGRVSAPATSPGGSGG